MTQPLGDAMARVLRMPDVAGDPSSARLTAWLVGESGDFVGAQGIATVETDSSLLRIGVAEAGVLIKSLVVPGQHVEPGSALAVLAAPGEVVEDVEQLMVQLGLAVAPEAQVSDAYLRALSPTDPTDPLGAITWPPLQGLAEPVPIDGLGTDRPSKAEASEGAHAAESIDGALVADRFVGWADTVAAAVVTIALGDLKPTVATAELGQIRLRALVRADRLHSVTSTVDSVSLIGLMVKAVATASRHVPLQPRASAIPPVAVLRLTPSGTITRVVHVANLMTASSVTSTIIDLDARAARGRTGVGQFEPATVLVVDLTDDGVAEGAMDATDAYPAVLVIGDAREQALVEDGVLVPAPAFGITLSCAATRIDVPTAARWFSELSRLLEQPLRFLT